MEGAGSKASAFSELQARQCHIPLTGARTGSLLMHFPSLEWIYQQHRGRGMALESRDLSPHSYSTIQTPSLNFLIGKSLLTLVLITRQEWGDLLCIRDCQIFKAFHSILLKLSFTE